MTNLRIVAVTVLDSTHITAKFTETLSESIGVDNISFDVQTPGIPTPNVLAVTVSDDSLNITTDPLTPLAAYFIVFQSTIDILFNSINGDAVLLVDGITNRQLILGASDSNDPVIEYFNNFFRDNVYDLESPSVVSKYIQGVSSVLSKSLYDIRQTKSENYLSFLVTDEVKKRGPGAFDRLNEEGVYEVLRVGKTKTGAPTSALSSFTTFPSFPVSLLAADETEILTTSSKDKNGTFNPGTLTINLSNQFVIILKSVRFIYNSVLLPYEYNIDDLGYQIQDSKYDPEFAFTYLLLTNSQIRLSNEILKDPLFSTENIASVEVSYQFKNTGKIVDSTTLSIDSILSSGREATPPLENIFALQHAPIVTNTDTIGSVGSVVFIDPNALPGSNTDHPAFVYEVPFRLDYLPSRIGEYSIDYASGTVYVFGSDSGRNGTGAFPPIATYSYRYVFKNLIDYVYDSDAADLVALPNGSLLGSSTNIVYNYEQVLVNGIDYKSDVHIEVLNERVNNNLVALNTISAQNTPITNVFRVFNETTGEIYKVIRWNDNKVFFNASTPPSILSEINERASFQTVTNETLFVSNFTVISLSVTMFKIFLNNDHVIASSEDCIGSSINTSVNFSNLDVFKQEVYYDNNVAESINNSRLTSVGDYQIDYVNGVVWCFVSAAQELSIGTISYKRGHIQPKNPHVITVDDIFYRFSALDQKIKSFSYVDFSDGDILPSSFDIANESLLSGNINNAYLLVGGQVGGMVNASFTPGVTNTIKFVRGLFEHADVVNNRTPLNFASSSTSNGKTITVAPLQYDEYHTVSFDGTHYYILLNTNVTYLSPNISIGMSVIRLNDSAQLWNGSGTIVAGTPLKIILPGINATATGNSVLVSYTFTINDTSSIVVDYNKGDYFVDYTYLADEIILSYEYGDNFLDFRESNSLNENDTYYVTYRAGALRDALLSNFGSLINIPVLNNLDVTFERERYRDALMAAMQSFTQGPTLTSMKNIVSTIVHTPPEIKESAFQNWSLGNSLLNLEPISTTGEFKLVPAKYDNGVLINSPNQTISFPTSSNLRLEQGTLETWIIPDWNGIDNESNISISVLKDGYILPEQNIFIGPAAYHPMFDDGTYTVTLDKNSNVLGQPNQSKDGVFLYYTADPSGKYNRWYLDVLDGYADGYAIKDYQINISTTGKFYDVKSTIVPQPASTKIFSGTNTLTFTIKGTADPMQGITFLADNPHYIFDFGSRLDANRFSLFKDESGYLNFKVIDKNKISYLVSADVSSWTPGQQHHVAVSWSLSTKHNRDELHLFVDGFEVPNILKYKDKISPYLHEKYRTIDPEEVIGVINKNIVSSTDMITTSGSNIVSSSLNFNAYGILAGDVLYVEESGFSTNGYTILTVSGNTLILTSPLPITSTGSLFSINKTMFPVSIETDLYPNVAISLLHSAVNGSDLVTTATSNIVSSASTNFTTNQIKSGYVIRIVGLPDLYTIVSVSGNNLTLSDKMISNGSGIQFFVYSNIEQEIPGTRALRPAYAMERDGYGNYITILDKALKNDIVLIRTLGLNNRRISKKYYVWSNTANVIMTRLPSPILLDDVKITHVILDGYDIGPSNSSLGGGIFTSNLTTPSVPIGQPSISDNGRTLSIYVSGKNVDYSTPVQITIHGSKTSVPVFSETVTFTQNNTQPTLNKFLTITGITIVCKPKNTTKNCITIQIEELYPITIAEVSTIYPVIRYSHQTNIGNTLSGTGNTITDLSGFFSIKNVGSYLIIHSPAPVAGQYQITDISLDHLSATLSTSLPAPFVNGNYEILDVSTTRSGLQNGFFTFEEANAIPINTPYNLVQGIYKFDYYTYLSIPIELSRQKCFIGSDIHGKNQVDATIDEFNIVSEKLTDVRIGEIIGNNIESVTKDFNSLKELEPQINTLMLCHFNYFPFVNEANVYTTASGKFIQSSSSVNDNFSKSISFTDVPMEIDNTGILNTKKEGSVEFWISSMFDTGNDPNYRFYFDASSAITENVISDNNVTIKLVGRASQVLSVKLKNGPRDIDYFAGGHISSDGQTITLNRPLLSQQMPVIINYVPTGVNGDRISIYKDPSGYINFTVRANQIDYSSRSPAFWVKDSWHRLKATFKFNQGVGTDEIRFFVDGYERGNTLFGNGLLFGQNQVFGSSSAGKNDLNTSISFKDTINNMMIGSDYTGAYGAYAFIDNLRISNISRPLFMPFGESIDVNYSTNTNIVFPVVPDLYTTLLLDFENLVEKNTNFSTLKNKKTGLFDFSINIFDLFGIVNNSTKVKQVLETLINTLKPANSRVFIKYIK